MGTNKFNSLLLFGILSLFSNGTESLKKTLPTLLTDIKKPLSIIPIAVLDQCFPREQSATFGIEFRLPKVGGTCKGGLLICYKSMLASRTLDMTHREDEFLVNSERYNVDNTNELSKDCDDLSKSHRLKDKQHWHGINVLTEQKMDGTSTIQLSMSMTQNGSVQSFEIPDVNRQFVLHLGNSDEQSAYVTIDFGKRIKEIDETDAKKRDAYKKLAPEGALLKNFVGFWTLGIDMMPWNKNVMELFVGRSCNCTMDAWFIRPTDEEPEDVQEVTTGSEDHTCKQFTNITMDIGNNTTHADQLIHIAALIDKNTDQISCSILAFHQSDCKFGNN